MVGIRLPGSTAILLVALALPEIVHAQDPVVLQQPKPFYSLGWHLQYLEDRQRQWTIEQVSRAPMTARFINSDSEVINVGFTASAYWFRLQLQNQLEEQRDFFLEVAMTQLDRIELFVQQPDGTFERTLCGDTFPQSQKAIRYYSFVFPLTLDLGRSQHIYLRIQTEGAMQLPLKLWSHDGFLEHAHRTQLAYGIYFGLLGFILLFNLYLFISIRDRSYLYYVLYILSALVYQSSFEGLAQEYLWPNWPWWAHRAVPFSVFAVMLTSLLFARDFLKLGSIVPGWDRILAGVSVVAGLGLIGSLVLPYNVAAISVAALTPPSVLIVLVAAGLAWRRGFRPARLYLAAWVTWLLGSSLLALNRLGAVPKVAFTENAHLVGFAVMAVLLSIALADRINLMKREKEQAEAEAIEAQKQVAQTLEQEVQRTTLDLQRRTEELADAYESLAEHDRLKSVFFTNVSHELRSPLTLILTPIEGLLSDRSGELPEAVKDRLRSMEANIQRLLRLVSQLLDFARLESGSMDLAFELVDLRDLVSPIIQAFEPFAQTRGIQLQLKAPRGIPSVYADPSALDKVICNLLSNACKFTDQGGKVIVQLGVDENFISISIKDTGIGIHEQELPRIFERFVQVESSTLRGRQGSGIGLALSKELVEATGGELEVESEPGFGSTFTVRLPLGTKHIEDPSMIRSRTDADSIDRGVGVAVAALRAEEGVKPTGEMKVLNGTHPLVIVVEDNPDMRALVTEICRDTYRVLEAQDGQEGLELIQQHRPALVISDIMMPRMDGYELLRRLRSDGATSSIPVMLLTAKAGAELRLEGLECGADDYLVKPFQARELRARAQNLIRLQRQEQQLKEAQVRLQQEVVSQASMLERARALDKFLPSEVAREVRREEDHRRIRERQQRRVLTVFVLELRGFEELVELMEPEDLVTMLNGYLSQMIDVALAHGATVDKFIVDRLVGFFGAPRTMDVKLGARKCKEMAVEMWHRAVEICESWRDILQGAPPVPTMVIVSGYTTIGFFGSSNRLSYTAVGGAAKEAWDLLAEVTAGALACCHTTWTMFKDETEEQQAEELNVDLRRRSVKLYRLAGPPDGTTLDDWSEPMAGDTQRDASFRGELKQGQTVAGRYEILSCLGDKGLGTVYRVRDLRLETEVGLRMLPTSLRPGDSLHARLFRMARVVRLVSHPNIARIFDVDAWQGFEFITMEYVQGETLEEHLRASGEVTPAGGLELLRQMCAGLNAAHTAGITHGYLNPVNIRVEPGGRLVIMNLGLAKWTALLMEAGTDSLQLSLGKPEYMAPEQFLGRNVDHRADIYSLGAIAFRIFTGRSPFSGDSLIDIADKHTQALPPNPLELRKDLPPRLASLILHCLEKQPQHRFASIQEIKHLLEMEEVLDAQPEDPV